MCFLRMRSYRCQSLWSYYFRIFLVISRATRFLVLFYENLYYQILNLSEITLSPFCLLLNGKYFRFQGTDECAIDYYETIQTFRFLNTFWFSLDVPIPTFSHVSHVLWRCTDSCLCTKTNTVMGHVKLRLIKSPFEFSRFFFRWKHTIVFTSIGFISCYNT